MTREVEVWLDAKGSELCRVGTLNNDRGQIRFRYAPDWLSRREAFALDPDLTLDAAPFFPGPTPATLASFSTPRRTVGARCSCIDAKRCSRARRVAARER